MTVQLPSPTPLDRREADSTGSIAGKPVLTLRCRTAGHALARVFRAGSRIPAKCYVAYGDLGRSGSAAFGYSKRATTVLDLARLHEPSTVALACRCGVTYHDMHELGLDVTSGRTGKATAPVAPVSYPSS